MPPTSYHPPSPVTFASTLFAEYAPPPHLYDEFMSSAGHPRPEVVDLLTQLDRLGAREIQRRWELAQRQMQADGVTFHPFHGAGAISRPWVLDALPWVVGERDWERVSLGLAQRARLWELVLRDLHGPRLLIRNRVLPPELLFAHPAYRPAYAGLNPPNQPYLTLVAAELGRTAEGGWCVTGDRTRAPLGLGYALENRLVASRMLPEAFRDCRVRPVAPFFATLQEVLRRRAPDTSHNPRIVLWSDGPQSSTGFEDAYLARYLGLMLAEGGDLTVREQRVMYKTLSGLLPVDVLFRRVDDEHADPVELAADSAAGIPGLLDTIRARRVAVTNALGSRLVESPALAAYLPRLCRVVLSEELRIPSISTWWCGRPDDLAHVLASFDDVAIRPAFREQPGLTIRPRELTTADREILRQTIRRQPGKFVAQSILERSSTPVWSATGPKAWRLAWRMFLIQGTEGWTALPGGLGRVSMDPSSLGESMTSGERSQDVWVLSADSLPDGPPAAAEIRSVELRRTSLELSSRVADHLFWLGRQVERADGQVRLLRTVILELLDPPSAAGSALATLLRVMAEQGQIEAGYVLEDLAEPLPAVEEFLPEAVFDTNEPGSLRSTVQELVRLASTLRERLAPDAWQVIHRIDEDCRRTMLTEGSSLSSLLEMMDRLVSHLSAFAGLVSESMTRTQAWRFLDLGRRLERACQTTFLLRQVLVKVSDHDAAVLEAVLRTMDSLLTYRIRYQSTVQAGPVVDLLLTDETNPRAIGFQIARIVEHVEALPREEEVLPRNPEQKLALSLCNSVRQVDVFHLTRPNRLGDRRKLQRFLSRLNDRLQRLSEVVSGRYLIHAGLPRHLAGASRKRP